MAVCSSSYVNRPGYSKCGIGIRRFGRVSSPSRTSIPTVGTLQRYADRRVLVTGAGSGISQATVFRIPEEGGTVVAADVSEAGLADTKTKASES